MTVTAKSEKLSIAILAITILAMIANCFWAGFGTLNFWFSIFAITLCCRASYLAWYNIKLLRELEALTREANKWQAIMQGHACAYCEEPILPGEPVHRNEGEGPQQVWHRECIFRAASGSVAHMKGECKEAGGHLGSCVEPDHVSKREGAKAAFAYYQKTMGPVHGFAIVTDPENN